MPHVSVELHLPRDSLLARFGQHEPRQLRDLFGGQLSDESRHLVARAEESLVGGIIIRFVGRFFRWVQRTSERACAVA